ncbi:hypothetical protein BGZ49_003856 [Haplosporangium sp. Z 27]|nr:hypothetical protein BGZ49_003856 [Haplosporangium sp. Z 27]
MPAFNIAENKDIVENDSNDVTNNGINSNSGYQSYGGRAGDTAAHGPSSLDPNILSGQEAVGKTIDRSITPNHEPRVFFFDIDNCLYPKQSGIHDLMREKIENYFLSVGFEASEVKTLSYRYYLDYGLAVRGLRYTIIIDIKDYDSMVDDALPLEDILSENKPLREMLLSLNIEKKWLFTNAGKKHALRVIKCLGLEGCFDGLTYCDYKEPQFICKPEAEAFHRAMRDAGVVHASNCYFVDDSAANIDKALDIGWTAVHVADDPEVSTFGHFQISNILELPKVLPEFWETERTSTYSPPPCRSSSNANDLSVV